MGYHRGNFIPHNSILSFLRKIVELRLGDVKYRSGTATMETGILTVCLVIILLHLVETVFVARAQTCRFVMGHDYPTKRSLSSRMTKLCQGLPVFQTFCITSLDRLAAAIPIRSIFFKQSTKTFREGPF